MMLPKIIADLTEQGRGVALIIRSEDSKYADWWPIRIEFLILAQLFELYIIDTMMFAPK